MNIFSKVFTPVFLATVMLASCNSSISTPTMSTKDIMQTAISTASTALDETHMAIPPSNTPFPLPTVSFNMLTPSSIPTLVPTSTPLVFTDPSIPLSERIVYYYLVNPAENPFPEGTVRAVHLFAPTYADQTYTSDTAADLRTALELVLHVDPRAVWDSSNLEIVGVTFRNGHADVVLQGEYFAAGDAQPCAASLQILMTVFTNPAVQTASITLNEDPIGILCMFRAGDPPLLQTVDDIYTRAVIETYINENAYTSP